MESTTPPVEETTGSTAEEKAIIELPTQKEGVLTDGRTFEVKKGKGKHAMRATRISGGNEEKYMPAIMSMLVLIDGKAIVIEDLEEMDLEDYMTISGEFSSKNFSAAKT